MRDERKRVCDESLLMMNFPLVSELNLSLLMRIKAPVGTIQYNTIFKTDCTIVLYLRF